MIRLKRAFKEVIKNTGPWTLLQLTEMNGFTLRINSPYAVSPSTATKTIPI